MTAQVDVSELCKVCQKDDPENDHVLVLCDGCDSAYHTFCFKGCTHCKKKPPGGFGRVPPVPENEWFCKFCRGRPPKTPQEAGFMPDVPRTYSFGNNEGGQLGLGKREADYEATPRLIEDLKGTDIAIITLGGYNSALLSIDGRLYSAGDGHDGKTGHIDVIHESLEHFRLVESLKRENVTKNEGGLESVCLGEDFGIAVSQNGHAYTWGCGENGKLGHQEMNNKKQPKKISALRESEISLSPVIACGSEHIIGINRLTGELYSWGLNTSSQLGLGTPTSSHWVPKIVNPFELTRYKKKQTNCPIEDPVMMMSCGRSHSLVLCEGHKVYSCGSNVNGQLGFPVPEIKQEMEDNYFGHQQQAIESDFKLIDDLNAKGVIQIEAGASFSLCLTNAGYVIAFGQNNKGQLGLGRVTQYESRPQVIPTLKHITRIAAGQDHALALSVTGEVFSWGANQYGQLGQGNNVSLHTPRAIQGLPKIGRIFCGGNHSFVIESVDSSARKRKHSSSGQSSSAEDISLPPAVIDSSLPGLDSSLPPVNLPSMPQPLIPLQTLNTSQQFQQLPSAQQLIPPQQPQSHPSSSSSHPPAQQQMGASAGSAAVFQQIPLVGSSSSSSSSAGGGGIFPPPPDSS